MLEEPATRTYWPFETRPELAAPRPTWARCAQCLSRKRLRDNLVHFTDRKSAPGPGRGKPKTLQSVRGRTGAGIQVPWLLGRSLPQREPLPWEGAKKNQAALPAFSSSL